MLDVKSLFAKFSPEARARRAEIIQQLRMLLIESSELSTSELRRLRGEGKDFPDECTVVSLMRQQLETLDFSDPMSVGVLALLSDSAKSEAKSHYSAEMIAKRRGIQARVCELVLEELALSVKELQRLALDSSDARERRSCVEAAAFAGLVRQQMETEDLDNTSETKGVVGLLLETIKSVAKDETKRHSQNN